MITQFVETTGGLTRCMIAGPAGASALLLIHGVSLTSEIWIRNIDALAERFRVVAVDMLGHGFSKPNDGKPVDFGRKLEHLEELIGALALEDLTVCGSSYGGLVAANLLLRKRVKVQRLIINGSGSTFNTEEQLAAFVKKIAANYRPRLTDSSPSDWRLRMRDTVFDPASVPCELLAVLPTCYAQPWALACWETTIGAMGSAEFRPFRVLDRLEAIDVPSLIVWGRDDKGGVYSSAENGVARMPRARLVAFERCGHLPMLEHPERFNRLVDEFIGPGERTRGIS